ncbi:hypothetical protein PN36_34700 [Candidatus Thiomargarita nelsonii]|uniref:EamA domain-containing protein n=1 Tax=Candidatus Thiomargarita nelsonii TaxID=1003181 RepID=A0A0A6RLW7_9GAMM|nr:hypothetical protein PN36_34700 [Candidatus Thiomargarita nelsonii]
MMIKLEQPHILFGFFLAFLGTALFSFKSIFIKLAYAQGLENISAGLERLTLFTYPVFVSILGALFFNTPLNKKIIITLFLTYSVIVGWVER